MPKINLLPPEYKIEHKTSINGILVTALLISVCIFLAFGYYTFWTDYQGQKKRLAEIEKEITTYQPIMTQYNALKKAQREREKLRSYLQEKKTNRFDWSRFLVKISASAGTGITLDEITTGNNDIFVIKGVSSGFDPVGSFYLKLKALPYVENLSIKVVNKELTTNNTLVIRFILDGRLRKGGTN